MALNCWVESLVLKINFLEVSFNCIKWKLCKQKYLKQKAVVNISCFQSNGLQWPLRLHLRLLLFVTSPLGSWLVMQFEKKKLCFFFLKKHFFFFCKKKKKKKKKNTIWKKLFHITNHDRDFHASRMPFQNCTILLLVYKLNWRYWIGINRCIWVSWIQVCLWQIATYNTIISYLGVIWVFQFITEQF